MNPARFHEGLRLYHEGRYWVSHEAWEELWRTASGAEAEFLQALIQLDAALIHIERSEWHGVQRLLSRLLERLARCPDHFMGLDVGLLVEELRAVQEEVGLVQSGRKGDFNWALKPGLEIERASTDNEGG